MKNKCLNKREFIKMSRIHIKNSVVAYLEKTLTPAKQKEFQDHLLSCDSCRLFVGRFSAVYFSNDSLECPEINPYFYSKVVSKLQNGSQNEYTLPVSIIKSLRPVATGLFLLTAITFSIFFGNYIISSNHITTSSEVGTSNEISYEYYLNTNVDPMVSSIISNEN